MCFFFKKKGVLQQQETATFLKVMHVVIWLQDLPFKRKKGKANVYTSRLLVLIVLIVLVSTI